MGKNEVYDEETEAMLAMIDEKIAQAQAQGGSSAPLSPLYAGQQKQNLVEWQLDFKPELLAITRSLRNDVLTIDNTGRQQWLPNPDKSKVLLNELGVNDVVKKIILLINKNKVLSNFGEDQITERVKAISHAIRELIYLNYEQYGMDNDYKWNCYFSLVVDINDMIESAYRRAINGEERRDLNQARVVEQKEPMMPNGQTFNMYPAMQQKRSMLNPINWFRR